MSAGNFEWSFARVLEHEGGFANHPADPGGPTKFGITLAAYRTIKPNARASDIRAMKPGEAKAIYRAAYWDAVACDQLPAGVDYALFDFGVNSGVARAKKTLQRLVGVTADGVLGPRTEAAIAAHDAKTLVGAICDERMRFLRGLHTWAVFGKGWARRVAEVRADALVMADRAAAKASRTFAAESLSPISSSLQQRAGGSIMWATIKKWCKNSETIFWARLQVAIGSAAAVVMAVAADPSVDAAIQAALKPEYVPYYIIAFGLLTEVLRRRRANDL